MYSHTKQIVTAGVPIDEAGKAMIMLHGRGATASGIVSLTAHLNLSETAVIAPQANENSWYPYSFMAPVANNEPALSSALALIEELVNDLTEQGIGKEKIYFIGFSQGACLALEYTARHGAEYAGIIALTGGLIGDKLVRENYSGDFKNTPVLLSTGDPDPHVPLNRVEASALILKEMNADVLLKIYKGRAHTVTADELELAVRHVLKNS